MKEIIEQAREKKLSEKSYWRRLLHIEKDGAISNLKGDFFIDKKGNQYPQRELEATLKAFMMTEEEAKLWEKERSKSLTINFVEESKKGQKR